MGERWVDSKVVVLGSSFVGKTCLALRYVNGSFPGDVVPTLSATYLSKSLEVNGAHLNLQLWDTAGQACSQF
ncbi:hypothetical protein Pelo_15168 [Pelomyxa schiedti]|nr:hypothetical protein Pelo_15168 [Pelomyxa schiedti]